MTGINYVYVMEVTITVVVTLVLMFIGFVMICGIGRWLLEWLPVWLPVWLLDTITKARASHKAEQAALQAALREGRQGGATVLEWLYKGGYSKPVPYGDYPLLRQFLHSLTLFGLVAIVSLVLIWSLWMLR